MPTPSGGSPPLEPDGLPAVATVTPQEVQTLWAPTLRDPRLFAGGDPETTYKPSLPAVEPGASSRGDRDAGGEFDFLEKVGEGGMGVVVRARQKALRRDVAVKQVKEHGDASVEEQFRAEALTTGYLDHPNIVPVHDLGRDAEGRLFMALKLVRGRPWKYLLHPRTEEERAAAASIDLEGHLRILLSVCNAVAFAHSRRILHRDLKPENVMIGEFGEVLLMDWGIAVDFEETPRAPRRAAHWLGITSAAGTPVYMAPEMALVRPRQFGPWTDIYLLGGILHELLTGAPPHVRETLGEVLVAAARSEPPTFPPEVPGELAAVCRRALERDPEARYRDVGAFKKSVEDFLKHRESIAISDRARKESATLSELGVRTGPEQRSLYDRFAGVVTRFEQALELWPENESASKGAVDARLDYARAALSAKDLGLARAQAEAAGGGEPRAGEVLARVDAEERNLRRRERGTWWLRRGLAAAAAVIFVGVTVAFFWIRAERNFAERQRILAEARAREANFERKKAVEARDAEEVQRAKAVEAAGLAAREADKARRAQRLAVSRAEEARRNLYVSRISLCEQALEQGNVVRVRELLASLVPEPGERDLRGFEWYHLWKRCHSEQVTLLTKSPRIRAVDFSPDGTQVAISDGKAILLWDGKRSTTLGVHEAEIACLAYSPDGKSVAAGSADERRPGDLRVWDVATGKSRRIGMAESKVALSLAMSPDGAWVAVGTGKLLRTRNTPFDRFFLCEPDDPSAVMVVPLRGEEGIRSLTAGKGGILSLDFAPDGKHVVAGTHEGDIVVWAFESGAVVRTWGAHLGPVWSVAYSPDGKVVASGGGKFNEAGELKIWDASTGQEKGTLRRHTAGVTRIAFISRGRRIVSAGWDNTVRILGFTKSISEISTVGTGEEEVVNLHGHSSPVWCFSLSSEGRLATATWGTRRGRGEVKIWDLSRLGRHPARSEYQAAVQRLDNRRAPREISRDGNIQVVQDGSVEYGELILTDKATGREERLPNSKGTRHFALSPDGRVLVTCNFGNKVHFWDVPQRKIARSLELSGPRVAISRDGKRVAVSCDRDFSIRIFDLESLEERAVLKGHTDHPWGIQFSPDGSRLASAGWDRTARIWNVATGDLLITSTSFRGTCWYVDWNEDGRGVLVLSSISAINKGEGVILRAATDADVASPPREVELEGGE